MSLIESLRASHQAWQDDAGEASWLAEHRKAGLARFEELGFPTIKTEAWKYTSLRKITKVDYAHGDATVDPTVIDAVRVEGAVAEVVFVDGRFDASRSTLPQVEGLAVLPLAQAAAAEDSPLKGRLDRQVRGEAPFAALNTAFLQDGVFISVDKGVEVSGPIHVIFVARSAGGPTAVHPRNVVVLGRHARATLVETHTGEGTGATFTNGVTEVEVSDGAELRHQVLGVGTDEANLFWRTESTVARDARYRHHATWLGGAITRNELVSRLDGAGAEVDLDGLYVLGGRQHVDNHTILEHVQPHGTSREEYKGVLGGRAKGVFDGLVRVHVDAQKTDASQANHNLLLSDDADANAKPTLEIYADDVKCAHGTTVGQLDAAQLWYLVSRGIPAAQARQILTDAFAADRVDALWDEGLKARLRGFVEAKLATLQEGR